MQSQINVAVALDVTSAKIYSVAAAVAELMLRI